MNTNQKQVPNAIEERPAVERRASERFNTDEAGTIHVPNSDTRVSCQVLNRSEGGVLLNVGASDWLPPQFILVAGAPKSSTICRIAWRIGSQVGCEFMSQLSSHDSKADSGPCDEPEQTGKVIKSRLLKRPLIVS